MCATIVRRPVRRRSGRGWNLLLMAALLSPAAGGIAEAAGGRRGFVAGAGEVPLVLGSAALSQSTSLDVFFYQRRQMVSDQILRRGIREERLLDAMSTVPRHEFVPAEYRARAYEDSPVPISSDTSISQPFVVALMTDALDLEGDETVLEIGTGSGYHTAILSRLARRVYTIEIDSRLGTRARRNLTRLGYGNIDFRIGDGYQGWSDAAPFDAIILTAAPPRIPQPLIDQLRVGGRMVVPLGGFLQDLVVIEKQQDGTVTQRDLAPVRLPEMTGEVQDGRGARPPAGEEGRKQVP